MNKPTDKPIDLDKKPNAGKATPAVGSAGEGQPWVMVFALITGQGPLENKKTYKLHKRRILVGSALSSDIRIQQNSVSNVHAVIELDDQNIAHVYDMASETGVFVNGQKVVSQTLKNGDELKIGFAQLAFSLQALKETAASIPEHAVQKSGRRNLFLNESEDFRPLILEDERNVIEIFDYPQTGQLALQVAQYWDSVILDIRHYAEQQVLQIGSEKNADFLVPGFPDPFPIISFENGECTLSFTEAMDGIVRTKQKLSTLKELKAERRESGASFRLVLKSTDFVKLQVNGITFFISFTPAPPHLKRQRVLERDPFFFRIWFSSLLLSILFIVATINIAPEKKLEVAELPPRVATIIFKPVPPPVVKPKPVPQEPVAKKEPPKKLPEKVKAKPVEKAVKPAPKPTPKPVTKPVAKQVEHKAPAPAKAAPTKAKPTKVAGGSQGEGAKAKGAEGKKGAPNAPKADVAQQKSHGNPNSTSPAKSQGAGKGVVESLTGDLSGAISKSLSAGGAGASAAAGRLRGYGGFTTEGNGGLGQMGSGAGGGGESLDVSGAGTKGLGEGAVGKGLGAIGEGGNILGTGRGRPSIEIGGTQETIIMGGLDKDLIDQIIQKHKNQIRYCYEKEANAGKPNLKGRILTRFVISASGRVSQSGIENTTMNNSNVERCLSGVISRIVFPEPLGGGIVEVSYPFSFTPLFNK